MLRLHDTAVGRAVQVVPREAGKLSMYVCGPTVYELPHLGHGRFALVFDVLRRYVASTGVEVTHVSNVTDVDDNIISRAQAQGRTEEEVVIEYEAAYWKAVDALGVARPTHAPHATDYVEHMVDAVAELERRGSAYAAPDGMYFAVGTVDDYGLLAHQRLESLQAGARVEVAEGKRSPLDFALWKLAKPGEPSWPSPWGAGRPGWHTECVVMALDLLGEGFDIHGGGHDLAFPHHENERAQAIALGRRFARHWVHNGFVEVGGVKMSKSLQNFRTLVDLLERTDARAYRLLVLQSHYRSPIEVTDETITRAERSLATLDRFARRVAELAPVAAEADVVSDFRSRMDDDLDTPAAVALLFDLVHRVNGALDRGEVDHAAPLASAAGDMTAAMGLVLRSDSDEADAEDGELVTRRDEARRERDFAAADSLREQLEARGWVVEDTAGGTRLHRRGR